MSFEYLLTVFPGPPRKICKAEQDCFGAPGTGWDFSQNRGFELPPKKWRKWK